MNVDSPRDSNSPCEVVSKYFTNPVMDESLSDFKEKKNFTGPKKAEKPKVEKVKPKKVPKRIKGQKDIRTVLRSKKNELVSYSHDFDKVCKQSGIDVDSEQLQLAIALSKSLQSTENPQISDAQSSSQGRTGKIRTTLQEYGFKVPEIKPSALKNKRLKTRKQYKLLLTTDEEKAQIISDRYAQVLLRNLDSCYNTDQITSVESRLYQKATQITIEYLKNDSTFYVENLIEQSGNTVGSLLRDWSEIPGRPSTPKICEHLNINFNELDCSQEELDSVLSGTLRLAQTIIKSKQRVFVFENNNCALRTITNLENRSELPTNMEEEHLKPMEIINKGCPKVDITEKNNTVDLTKAEVPNIQPVTNIVRSCSPDIFDDEVSSLMDISKESNNHSVFQNVYSKDATESKTDFMDLTECINAVPQQSLNPESRSYIVNSQLSQGSNRTRQKSNDFMDITSCVAGSSQPLLENIIEENIDLTQTSDEHTESKANEILQIEHKVIQVEHEGVESMDLTQSSNTDDELPFVQIKGTNQSSLDDTIMLNEDVYIEISKDPEKCILIDDSVSEATSEKNTECNGNLNLIATEDQNSTNLNTLDSKNETAKLEKSFTSHSNSCEISLNTAEISYTKSKTESFFDEFVHHHSDDAINEKTRVNSNSDEDVTNLIVEKDSKNSQNKVYPNDESINIDNVDLTHSPNSTKDTVERTIHKAKSPQISCEYLGKKDDVSIDYDEIFDEIVEGHSSKNSTTINSKSVGDLSNDIDVGSSENLSKSNPDYQSNSSQESEVYDIVDEELNYSMNKSRHDNIFVENFEFGGISVLDDLSNARISKSDGKNDDNVCFASSLNRSMSESFLPAVNVKGTDNFSSENYVHKETSTPFRPQKKYSNPFCGVTPSNSDYIIKTDQVTPMANYASMTTPERNKELDQYGLKPFKRKRAIQLLTHLYNQTHPIVESSSEDLPSPSKKRKQASEAKKSPKKQLYSPKKLEQFKSPSKPSKSPKKNSVEAENIGLLNEVNKENQTYEVTNDHPVIRDVTCETEDWVFQKREKAKVHSCRVPLHIAFHNYVSCRRGLREAILRYEPVNIDVIHKGLVANGFRYDPKDLLKFMDKKCITVKTADNNSRNRKHY